MTEVQNLERKWGFPKILWDLCWGPLMLGNYQKIPSVEHWRLAKVHIRMAFDGSGIKEKVRHFAAS